MQIGIKGFYEELYKKPFWLEYKSLFSSLLSDISASNMFIIIVINNNKNILELRILNKSAYSGKYGEFKNV